MLENENLQSQIQNLSIQIQRATFGDASKGSPQKSIEEMLNAIPDMGSGEKGPGSNIGSPKPNQKQAQLKLSPINNASFGENAENGPSIDLEKLQKEHLAEIQAA